MVAGSGNAHLGKGTDVELTPHKPVIENRKEIQVNHFHLEPKGFHLDYGLWIFNWTRNSTFLRRTNLFPRRFEFYGISHFHSGNGWYWSADGSKRVVHEGDVVISTPNFVQDYGAQSKTCREDSLCFCGPIADNLYRSGVLADGVFTMGKGRKLLPVIERAENPERNSQLRANLALQTLLTELHLLNQENPGSKTHDNAMDQLITIMTEEPAKWWTTLEMAQFCSLSENQFRRLFRKRTGLSPKLFVDTLRMRQAAERLCSGQECIAAIASSFGYSDPYHFSRRFKDVMGLSPEQYRKSYLLQPE